MVLSKGLVISLGFSALSCTLLFLYFRNKMTTMERKVNVMFDIVQNYQPSQEYSPQSNQSYEPVHENQEHPQDNQNNENTGAWNLNAQDDRIVISDDSDDEDDARAVLPDRGEVVADEAVCACGDPWSSSVDLAPHFGQLRPVLMSTGRCAVGAPEQLWS